MRTLRNVAADMLSLNKVDRNIQFARARIRLNNLAGDNPFARFPDLAPCFLPVSLAYAEYANSYLHVIVVYKPTDVSPIVRKFAMIHASNVSMRALAP